MILRRIGEKSSINGNSASRFFFLLADHSRIGRDRIGVFTGDCDKAAIKQFINRYDIVTYVVICKLTVSISRHHQILIIGYERLRGIM
jgi:DNA repair and recombination protein RAD54B